MGPQIESLKSKIRSSVNALRLMKYKPTALLLKFYFAFIHSHLQGNAFLLARASNQAIQELQTLQNRALKIVFKLDILHSTLDLYNNIAKGILPVTGLIYFSIICLTKKAIISTAKNESYLPQIKTSLERRSAGLAKSIRAKTNILKNDLSVIGPKLINQLPPDIRCQIDVDQFKILVKKFLVEKNEILLREGQLNQNSLL